MRGSLAVVGLVAIVATMSCRDPLKEGGGCCYRDIAGSATVVSVETAPAGESNCANAVKVIFNFIPQDPNARSTYRIPTWPDTSQALLVGDGKNPSRTWAEAQGLSVGSHHPCRRREITSGTCVPVIFEFSDVDYASYIPDCFPMAPKRK